MEKAYARTLVFIENILVLLKFPEMNGDDEFSLETISLIIGSDLHAAMRNRTEAVFSP